MLLFSTLLNTTSDFTRAGFISLVSQWNDGSKYAENRVAGVVWHGEKQIRFGTDRHSLEIMDYPEQDIMAVRHEKITEDEIVWDTDFVVNFRERKIAIRLDRTYSEDALVMNGAFSTPHFITLLINAGVLADDQELPVSREPVFITDENTEAVQHVLNATLNSQMQKRIEAEHARADAEQEIDDIYAAFDEDLKNLQTKVAELTRENEALQMENAGLRARLQASDAKPLIYQGDEEDFYSDEIKDMLIGMLSDTLNHTEEHTRRRDILEDIPRISSSARSGSRGSRRCLRAIRMFPAP